jgi:tetratricopeptide (TPR) repeat protein
VLGNRQFHYALLVALSFAAYSNNYRHAYQLDDAYTIVSNPSVRSLGEIPRYFVDPSTYTSLREQADYRPLLQVTYALDYRMGGYDMWWWHFTQIVLHALVTLGIYTLCRRILIMLGDPAPQGIALFAAIVFAIHPAASGVVNYLNARSSLLTAVFLLPALLAYMKPVEDDGYARPQWAAAAFYGLALFTKVEAIGALGAFWAFELWQRGRESPGSGIIQAFRSTLDRRTLRRIAPVLVVTAVYLAIRWTVMRNYPFASARHAEDVGPYQYFLTQLTAWWYYLLRWIAPVRLIADYETYPVYRSWSDPVVLFALGGWVMVGALLAAAWRRAPYVLFLAVAALALISPTSSFSPLAEMVNEHRPYLPMGVLSLALFIPAGRALRESSRRSVVRGVIAGSAIVLVSFAVLTYRRNTVFSTEARYWQDILAKAPSTRAHLNYGRTLMAAKDPQGALRHFQQSLELAPNWYFAHINLAAMYQTMGQLDSARKYSDRAVESDKFSGLALSFRGELHLTRGEFGAALSDFQRSFPLSLERYRNTRGLAGAYAGLGDVQRTFQETEQMLALDSVASMRDIAWVTLPFFERPNLRAAGVEYYKLLARRLPNVSWVSQNLATITELAAGRMPETARMRLPERP